MGCTAFLLVIACTDHVQTIPKLKLILTLKGQCHDIQWFLRFFCASKQWRLLAQMSRTSDHDSSVSRANNFTAQAESSKYRFPRPCPVAAIIFPHTKWLPKNHRLSWHCRFKFNNSLFFLERRFHFNFSGLCTRFIYCTKHNEFVLNVRDFSRLWAIIIWS